MGVSADTANAQNLSGVTVSANTLSQTFTPDNKGLSTNVSRRELDATPTPGRSIQNVVRLDPRVVITDRARGEISAVGQNSRYNNITVDSVSANDPFGLNANGLPTLGTPISQDTIEEYNISTANYDVATRRGIGANVNAVTKSGTNDFHGSVYYAFQNTDMIGDNELDKPYAGFNRQWTAGGTVGGPIIKDKLFFFASLEKSEQVGSGSPYGPQDSGAATPIKGLTNQQVQQVRDIAAKYGLTDIGSVGGGNSNLQDKRYLAKVDWNIADNHRASFTYSETKEQKPIITGSTTKLVLSSGWYNTNVDNKSYALHFYDDWSDIFSTDTTLSYANFDQNRGPYNGVAMPDITVYPVAFRRSGDRVRHRVLQPGERAQGEDARSQPGPAPCTLGDHTVKGGFDYEKDKYYNLFLQNYYGSYIFEESRRNGCTTGLDNFAKGQVLPVPYNRPADNLGLGDVAANYGIKQWGVFLQDTWQVTNNLSVQYGVRVDIPLMDDKPLYNAAYAGSGDDQPKTGAAGGYRPQQPVHHQRPSRGAAAHVVQLQLQHRAHDAAARWRGSVRDQPPTVWLGNIFSNSGVTQTQYNCGPTQARAVQRTNLPPFSPDAAQSEQWRGGCRQDDGQHRRRTAEHSDAPGSSALASTRSCRGGAWSRRSTTSTSPARCDLFKNAEPGHPDRHAAGRSRHLLQAAERDPKATGQADAYRAANPAFSGSVINLANTEPRHRR